jgi:tetratricopeptide (TPR) repeat protein
MLKKRIYISIGILLLILVALLFAAVRQVKHLHRDPMVLMNKYYQFKNIRPDVAKKALLILLNQDHNYLPAVREYSQWLLNSSTPQQALSWLEQLHQQSPENTTYTFQLAYLYYLGGEWEKSKLLFMDLLTQVKGNLKVQVLQALNAMASYVPCYHYYAAVKWIIVPPNSASTLLNSKSAASPKALRGATSVDLLLNSYYVLKEKNQSAAGHVIKQLIKKYPDNVQALKEAGFLALAQGRRMDAIHYFTHVYDLTHQPNIAMQLAYLYDQLNDKPAAYRYFKLATHGHDTVLALTAEQALTDLAGQQTKRLPAPYFSEIFLSPFSQSRFGLTVVPFYGRLGIEQNNRFQSKEYVFLRRTQDNRSANLGQISQIYEDDVQIIGAGAQITPLRTLPMVGFVEAGEAYDLVYQHRNRRRGDLRGGFMYFQTFGAQPTYVERMHLSYKYYSDLYSDATYFSRYNNNVIWIIKTHQGMRLLQYKSSMVNLYITGRVIADTHRLFYNNVAEAGPGIAIIPSNRLNLQLRFEHINGMYLPVGSSVNPYGKYYANQLVQLLFYIKI